MKKTIATIATLVALCFAQDIETPKKLAIYVSGAKDAGVNKSLSNKLTVAMTQSGEYVEIGNPGSFQGELAKSTNGDITYISQAAKRHGAEYVCVVSMTEALGAYSIIARLVKTSDFQIIKTGSEDRAIESLNDLTAVSKELARQLLSTSPVAATPPIVAAPLIVAPPAANPTAPLGFLASGSFGEDVDSPSPAVAMPAVIDRVAAAKAAALKQCARTYNINELLFKLKDGFPRQLKDCSAKLAKDMLTPAMLGGKKLGEPKSFMKQCAVDGMRNEIPDGFPDTDKIVGSVDNFVQSILNAASAGSGLDPTKLLSAVSSISTSINTLLSDVKKLSSNKCIVNEPYEPPDEEHDDEQDDESDSDKSTVSFGIRTGLNLSHIYAKYDGLRDGTYRSIGGMQLGVLFDIAASKVFHFQPGLMYIQKGMNDYRDYITAHYLEIPMLLSLKLSALRLNAGTYSGICLTTDNEDVFGFDFGISTGLGFDIGWFYIGMLYNYGLTDMSKMSGSHFYNRTLGFNVGVNL